MKDLDDESPAATPAADSSGLPEAAQRKNSYVFAALISLTYFTAPVLYVGMVQAALCKRLELSNTLANLPTTVYLAMAWFPVVCAWWFPQARMLRPLVRTAYAAQAIMGAIMAAVLLLGAPNSVVYAALVAHATILGCANNVTLTLNWEALRRGTSECVRGKALGLAFGWGPGFAVVGSLTAQLLLEGKLFGWTAPASLAFAYPYNYAILFGFSLFTMAAAAFIARRYEFQLPATDVRRESFSTAVFGGFRSVLTHRVLLIACIVYLLVFCGNMVQVNMSIFTHEAVGRSAEDLAGYQLALRFSFKMLAGMLLGWLLARTNPKMPLLVTVGLQIAGVLWVLLVPGYWFLLAFGINGAGELFGVYYVNYPVSCSRPHEVRRNIAFLTLASSLVGLAPLVYGWIADTWSLRASFWAALVLLLFTAALVLLKLPSRPKPPVEDESELKPAAA